MHREQRAAKSIVKIKKKWNKMNEGEKHNGISNEF